MCNPAPYLFAGIRSRLSVACILAPAEQPPFQRTGRTGVVPADSTIEVWDAL